MPEYLSPDVYVEEIDTGPKPIEGVSTSTAGMLGVTERGPANVPILVTSYCEYTRWFGDWLDPDVFHGHGYLPYSVDGFFTNGGKRLCRAHRGARRAALSSTSAIAGLGDLGPHAPHPAGEATGIAGSPIYVLNVADIVPRIRARSWPAIASASAAAARPSIASR